MIVAADTSTLIAYLQDEPGRDVELLEESLATGGMVLAPVVLTEILSDPALKGEIIQLFLNIPILELTHGFWERAGRLRSQVVRKKQKARLADTLIAQVCIDHRVPLITRDKDFKNLAKESNLVLL